MNKIKYLGVYIIPLLGLLTFNVTGIYAFFGLFFLFVLVPLLELVFSPNNYNFTQTEQDQAQHDLFYDRVLFLLVPLHIWVVYSFLTAVFKSFTCCFRSGGLCFYDGYHFRCGWY